MELSNQSKALIIYDTFGKLTMFLPINACVFCKHCSDFFYDYTNGPYLIACDIENHPDNSNGTCELFIDKEVVNNG